MVPSSGHGGHQYREQFEKDGDHRRQCVPGCRADQEEPGRARHRPRPAPRAAVTREQGELPAALPDSVPNQWLLRAAPAAWRPYIELARLDRPIGWWLLLLPCWWSSTLASVTAHAPPNPWHLALFLIGAIAMRGAGTTYNDLVDRDIDAAVARTRGRPLPSGRVSVRAARSFLVVQALVGLAVLLSFNRFAIMLGFSSLLIVAIYPFMKRVTFWPQAVLGLAFGFGALIGWAAAFGSLAAPA